jgi:hypothetical protein
VTALGSANRARLTSPDGTVALAVASSHQRHSSGVLIVGAVIIAVGYFLNGPTPGYPILHVFGGFLLGILSMYIAMRV